MTGSRPLSTRLAPLFWILVLILGGFLSSGYIRTKMNDDRFSSDLDYVVQQAGNENRPQNEVKDLILAKANNRDIQIRPDQIRIAGARQNLQVSVSYGVDIEVPILHRVLYHKDFNHEVSYRHLP